MTCDQHGPDAEQLNLEEDVARLMGIGDLVRGGHARLRDFNLRTYELAFMRGYLGLSHHAQAQADEP